MRKFALMMLGVTPLFCSDLCAYAYDRCVTAIGFRSVRFTTKTGIKSASHSHASGSHSSGSGCSCGGVGRGYSECDEDDDGNSFGGNGVKPSYRNINGKFNSVPKMDRNMNNDPYMRYYIKQNPTLQVDGYRKGPTGSEVIRWSTPQ